MEAKLYPTKLSNQGANKQGTKKIRLVLMLATVFFLVAGTSKVLAKPFKHNTGYYNQLDAIFHTRFSSSIVLPGTAFAPPIAPSISYTGVAAGYPTGTPIGALSPTVTGSSLTGNGSYGEAPIVLGAGFSQPQGITLDAAGNVYVADFSNSVVKKIAASDGAITIVGSGFNFPEGVAVDTYGNLYVADSYNDAVKKISVSDGAVTTLGAFSTPRDVAVDGAGNVFVADAGNSRIRKIAADGTTTTVGSGFLFPAGVAVDAAGNVYVADIGHAAVKKIAANGGAITTLCSGFSARYVAVDASGNIYVADISNNAVKKIDAGTGVITTVGSGFMDPVGIDIDGAGNVYVADGVNDVIIEITESIYSISPALPAGLTMDPVTGIISGIPIAATPTTTYTVTTQNAAGMATATLSFSTLVPVSISYTGVAASYPTGTAIGALSPTVTGSLVGNGSYGETPTFLGSGFANPSGVAVDGTGNIYIADYNNSAVKEIPAGGGAIISLGSGFDHPQGVAVDGSGNVYVAVTGGNSVKKIAAGNGAITTLGGGFSSPTSIALDGSGNIYVADEGHNAVKKIAVGTGVITNLGSGFHYPLGVAVDAGGNIYVTEYGQNVVKKIAAGNGTVTTLGAGFSGPYGIAVDGAGNVYVTDADQNMVRKIAAGTGVMTTLGSGFNYPTGVTLDGYGNVYVADFYNDAVKKITAYRYSINPALPAGLTMDPVTGIISGIPTAATPTTTYTVTTQNAAGMAMATITFSTSAALPVNWISVNGQLNNTGNAVLNWQVAEQSMASFDIQKSDNGSTFSTIGTVASKGNGTNSYSFTDRGVFNGSSVYRIAEIDQDGKRNYSPVISFTGNKQAAINVYPNPAKSSINIVIPGSLLNTNASVFNMNGSLVKRVHLSSLSNQVSVEGLASGMYMLCFKDGSSRQIIKE